LKALPFRASEELNLIRRASPGPPLENEDMRRSFLSALFAIAAIGSAPVALAQAQDLQDRIGRALEGFQGSDRQSPSSGYRDDERRYRDDDRRYRDDGRGYRDDDRRSADRRSYRGDEDGRWGDDRRNSEAERRLDEQQRRLDAERRRLERDRR
jgi:hypothetical protein